MASEASAPLVEAHAGQTATPNPRVATGKTNMASFGARLASQMTITRYENEENYPVRIHVLDAGETVRMFHRMFMQLVLSINRELGQNNPSDPAQQQILRNIAYHLAHAALVAAYAVTYNKARAHDPSLVRNLVNPSLTYTTFPVFITALINSLSPIQIDDIPSRRIHVPLFDMPDIDRLFPALYQANYLTLFKEKIQKTKILFANVEPRGAESVPWWTFWPDPKNQTVNPITDLTHTINGSSANRTSQRLKTITFFSPVKYDATQHYLKLPLIYARAPLASPGLGSESSTRYYEVKELTAFPPGTLPTVNNFPAETRQYPYFWHNTTAFLSKVETRIFLLDPEPAPAIAGPRAGSVHPRADDPPPRTRRRLTDSGHSAADEIARNEQREQIFQYRILYHYFDHIALRDIPPSQYINWVYELCQSNQIDLYHQEASYASRKHRNTSSL